VLRRWRCSLPNVLTVKYSEGRNGIGRRGTDPMSVGMLNTEGPWDNRRNETGGNNGTKDTSVVLLFTVRSVVLSIYGSISPLTNIAGRNFNIQRFSSRREDVTRYAVPVKITRWCARRRAKRENYANALGAAFPTHRRYSIKAGF